MKDEKVVSSSDAGGDAGLSALRLFRWASLVVGCAVGFQPLVRFLALGPAALPYLHMPLIVDLLGATKSDPFAAYHGLLLVCVVAPVAFVGAFWRCTRVDERRPGSRLAGWLVLQAGLALLVEPEWLYLVAAELPLVLPVRIATRWLAGQVLAFVVMRLSRLVYLHQKVLLCVLGGTAFPVITDEQRVIGAAVESALGVTFMLLAFALGALASQERARRERIAVAHAELQATRHLLRDAAAHAERLRVVRELHDSVGHHLTAMKLHLAMRRSAGGSAALRTASSLAQALLAEVRAVVGAERASAVPQERR